MKRTFLSLLLLLVSCQGNTQDSIREEGRAKTKGLISELKKIRTKDQLVEQEGRLYEKADQVRDLCSLAESYMNEHPEEALLSLSQEDRDLSDALRLELLRVQRLDGGKEILRTALERY